MKNFFIYGVLWIAGGIIAGAIVVMWNRTPDDKEAVSLFGKNASEIVNDNTSGNIVNELLLSAREINISGSNNLIDFNYKNNTAGSFLLTQEMKDNPEKIYQRILDQRLKKLRTGTTREDFDIRPVPK